MIPDNPDARHTFPEDHPTPEQIRAIVRYEFQEAVRLRYGLDDALDRTADAVYDEFPDRASEAYEDACYRAEDERDNALHSLDQAEETIRSLRAELAEANTTITRLCKES